MTDPCCRPDRDTVPIRGCLILHDACIVAGGDVLRIDLLSKLPQTSELQPVVALHARIRCASGKVFVRKVILDLQERILKIERMKGNAESICDPSCIRRIFRTAAALAIRSGSDNRQQSRRRHGAGSLHLTGPHKQSDHFIALLMQQHCGGRAVNSTAHRQYDAFSHSIFLIKTST